MKMKLLTAILAVVMITGCTGTKVAVSPEPGMLKSSFNTPYDTVGLRDTPADKIYPPAGNLTEAFGAEMRSSGFSKEVYYPFRPDDKVDLTLDTQFNVEMDPNMGSAFAKSFITGFTLFVLEPFFWYDYDYKMTGNINVIQDGKMTKTISAETNATMSMKWLSLSKGQTLEGETLGKAKKSLFRQLMQDLEK